MTVITIWSSKTPSSFPIQTLSLGDKAPHTAAYSPRLERLWQLAPYASAVRSDGHVFSVASLEFTGWGSSTTNGNCRPDKPQL